MGDTALQYPLAVFTKDAYNIEPTKGISYRLDSYCMLLLKKGSMRLTVNLEEYSISENTIVFLGTNANYSFSDFSKDFIGSCLQMSPEYLSEKGHSISTLDMLDLFVVAKEPFLKLREQPAENLFLLFSLLKIKLGPNSSQETLTFKSIDHLFELILLELTPEFDRQRAAIHLLHGRKDHLTVRFLEEVGLHFKKERSVKFYAKQLHISEKHLSRVVKVQSGKTASAIIDEAVIIEAKLLLRNPNVNIAEIADVLHFSDQSFFGKYFKKHTGYSPSEYRLVDIAA